MSIIQHSAKLLIIHINSRMTPRQITSHCHHNVRASWRFNNKRDVRAQLNHHVRD